MNDSSLFILYIKQLGFKKSAKERRKKCANCSILFIIPHATSRPAIVFAVMK